MWNRFNKGYGKSLIGESRRSVGRGSESGRRYGKSLIGESRRSVGRG